MPEDGKAGLETKPDQDKLKGGLETKGGPETKPDQSKDQANTGTAKKEQETKPSKAAE